MVDLQTLGCTPTNISYHGIHLILIIFFGRLVGCGWLHLPVLVPHQVVQHKLFLNKVSRHLILG
jgi:hypothetical protein